MCARSCGSITSATEIRRVGAIRSFAAGRRGSQLPEQRRRSDDQSRLEFVERGDDRSERLHQIEEAELHER